MERKYMIQRIVGRRLSAGAPFAFCPLLEDARQIAEALSRTREEAFAVISGIGGEVIDLFAAGRRIHQVDALCKTAQ